MQDPEIRAATPKKASLFGICQAFGDDFGFNPDYLRVLLAIMLLVNPVATLAAYAIAGMAVLASRLLVRRPASSATTSPSL